MKLLDENPSSSLLLGSLAKPTEQRFISETKKMSDRHAVIAIMFANGLTCEEIATRLSLALDTVHSHLAEALEILDLSDIDDLTYAVVAAHYNRNVPSYGG